MTSLYETFGATRPGARRGLPRELFPNETRVGWLAFGCVHWAPQGLLCGTGPARDQSVNLPQRAPTGQVGDETKKHSRHLFPTPVSVSGSVSVSPSPPSANDRVSRTVCVPRLRQFRPGP